MEMREVCISGQPKRLCCSQRESGIQPRNRQIFIKGTVFATKWPTEAPTILSYIYVTPAPINKPF